MKDATRRRRLRERRYTHDVSNYSLDISNAESEVGLHNLAGPAPVHRCVTYKDGSILALAGDGQLWFIYLENGTYAGTVTHVINNIALIRVHDRLAISIGHNGLIVSSFFKYPLMFYERNLRINPVSLAALSDTEFVIGDASGVLRFFEHRNGKNIRHTSSSTRAHRSSVKWIAVFNNVMVSVSVCSNVCVWDVDTRRRIAMLPHDYAVSYVAMNKHLIATSSFEEVRVFKNSPGYRLSHIFKGLNGVFPTYCVEVVGDSLLLTAGASSLIIVTSLITNLPIMCVNTSLVYIHDMTLAPDGRVIICCDKDTENGGDDSSAQSQIAGDENDRLVVLKWSRQLGLRKELTKEAQQRFQKKQKKINWKLGGVAVIVAAVTLLSRRLRFTES